MLLVEAITEQADLKDYFERRKKAIDVQKERRRSQLESGSTQNITFYPQFVPGYPVVTYPKRIATRMFERAELAVKLELHDVGYNDGLDDEFRRFVNGDIRPAVIRTDRCLDGHPLQLRHN